MTLRRAVGAAVMALVLVCLIAIDAPTAGGGKGWEEIRKDRLALRFRPHNRPYARGLMPDLDSSLAEVSTRLGGEPGDVTVYLTANETEFRELSGGRLPHWGVGYALPDRGVILLRRFPGQQEALLRTARHELAHIVLHRRVSRRLPVWFSEGVSMWIAREWRLSDSADVFGAVLSGGLVPLGEIDDVLSFASPKAQLAYTESQLALTFLIGLGGPESIREIVDRVAAGSRFDTALHGITGLTPARFEAAFLAHVQQRFSLAGVLTSTQAIWLYATGLLVLVFVIVRVRNRTRTRRWEEEDDWAALPHGLRLQVRRREDEP